MQSWKVNDSCLWGHAHILAQNHVKSGRTLSKPWGEVHLWLKETVFPLTQGVNLRKCFDLLVWLQHTCSTLFWKEANSNKHMRALKSFLQIPLRLCDPEARRGKRRREEADANITLVVPQLGINNCSLLRLICGRAINFYWGANMHFVLWLLVLSRREGEYWESRKRWHIMCQLKNSFPLNLFQ